MKKVDSKEMAQNSVVSATRFTPKIRRPFINHLTSYIYGLRDDRYNRILIGSSSLDDKWRDANLSYQYIYKAFRINLQKTEKGES